MPNLPTCHVPTHSDWKKLREKNGGKAGLSKVSLGKKLDEFHGVLKARDAVTAGDAVKTLETAARGYAVEIKAKYVKLAAAVIDGVLGPLDAFKKALADNAAVQEGWKTEVKQGLMKIITTTKAMMTELASIEKQVGALNTQFAAGVPADKAPAVKKLGAEFSAKLKKIADDGYDLDALAATVSRHGSELLAAYKESVDVGAGLMDQRRKGSARVDGALQTLLQRAATPPVKPA